MAAITMTDADRERWEPVLIKYYKSQEKSDVEIDEILQRVFAEVQVGWNRCPRDLDTRIKVKTGFQSKSHANLKPRKKVQSENEEVNLEEDEYGDDYLFSTMSNSEQEWWQERLDQYTTDFEFNESADLPLLQSLMVEELIQRRLHRKQLKNISQDYSRQLTDSLKRVTDCQTKLGITREQRAGALDNVEGNVAHLAVELENKLIDPIAVL